MTISADRWQGEAALTPGIGVFRGHSGDNRLHRHWAHQISLSLESCVQFEVGGDLHQAPGILIPAGVRHKQLEGMVLSVYVDPTSSFLPVFDLPLSPSSETIELPSSSIRSLESVFPKDWSLQESLDRLLALPARLKRADTKLERVLAALKTAVDTNTTINREQLARICHLSPSRFSHWFSQETGMPLRSYRKWLRLIKALETAVITHSLSRAAHDAGFSDQSHFSRAVSEAFGVSPRDILDLLG